MIHELIHLNKYYPLDGDPTLEVMIPYTNDINKRNNAGGIIICPGGGYSYVSLREGDSTALKYMDEGYCTFVLTYSTKKSYPTPMYELACSIDYLRKNSDKYYLNKDQIAILGYSAAGHLVSSYGYLYKNNDFLEKTKLDVENIKPNAIVSCYPVITMGVKTHIDTMKNITGNNDELKKLLSVEKNIDSTYPPTFLWTTKADTCVPYENSLMFAEQLKKNNIEYKFVLFKHLDHGKSVGTKLINDINKKEKRKYKKLSSWIDKSLYFLDEIFNK